MTGFGRSRPGGSKPETSKPAGSKPRSGHSQLDGSSDGAGNERGRALDRSVRAPLEEHFGHDFSAVRVHTDERAAERARSLGAHAFTVGENITFDRDRYRPNTPDGQRLLAHELTHVVQQRRLGEAVQAHGPGGRFHDPFEQEAEDEADLFGGRNPGGPLPYRQAMERMVPRPNRPPAARLHDTRDRVLQAERPMFEDLRSLIVGLPTRLRNLAGTNNPDEPWLRSDNVNVQSALRVLDQLAGDMAAERFVIRFDKPAGQAAGASYDYANDIMHLQPFSSKEELTMRAIDIVHEFTHVLQDREAEELFARGLSSRQATPAEALDREVEARQHQVYFAEMLRVLRLPVPTDQLFGSVLSNRVFRGQFEDVRTATTAAGRRTATRTIRSRIQQPYQAQIDRNGSAISYIVDLDGNNHAHLYWDVAGEPTPHDLGELPERLTNTEQLRSLISSRIAGLTHYDRLFDRPGGAAGGRSGRFTVASFTVAFDRQAVTSFAMEP
jgi:hypothetical protein